MDARQKRQELVQSILDSGHKAFNPDVTPEVRAEGIREFDALINR